MAALSLGSRGNGGGLHGTVPATLPPRSQRVINSCSPFAGAAAAGGSAGEFCAPGAQTPAAPPGVGGSLPAWHPQTPRRGRTDPRRRMNLTARASLPRPHPTPPEDPGGKRSPRDALCLAQLYHHLDGAWDAAVIQRAERRHSRTLAQPRLASVRS
ncbi:uncharacterized protein LOC115344588 isoform X2 [Aquila chrysaetos chrysaetos]|uniref:uncharacterized protein LOC115344588 isoform X2 n=1 Tax=Aquila chrysaetos chrysaetos TaxID=223781 RepID=UPI0011770F71|nr:uncharacterized protein LOC115344588 isoform X2 [Aquila chrysaetos chrysaetos]